MSRAVHGNDGVAVSVARLLANAACDGRARSESVVAELALPPEHRLRDDERAAIDRMADTLAEELSRALGGALADDRSAATTRFKSDPAIVAAFLRRIDEHRIATAWHDASRAEEQSGRPLLDTMLAPGHPDALGATALLIALGRRSDRFDDPILPFADLASPLRRRCAWIAAAQAPALAEAVPALLDSLANVPTADAHAIALARSIDVRGHLEDSVILRALNDGSLLFAIAALAVRAGIGFDPAWEMATGGETLVALLRAIGTERAIAGRVILGFAAAGRTLSGDAILSARVALFDALTPDQARSIASAYARDPDYRDALGRCI